jgi:hypothetical protein
MQWAEKKKTTIHQFGFPADLGQSCTPPPAAHCGGKKIKILIKNFGFSKNADLPS